MIQIRQMRGQRLGDLSPVDVATHQTIEVIDDLSFSERAVFAMAADGIAYYVTPTEVAPDPSGVTPTYDTRRLRNARAAAVGFRVGSAFLAPFMACRFGQSKRSGLELAGWALIGFFRPFLGNAAAMVRGGSR